MPAKALYALIGLCGAVIGVVLLLVDPSGPQGARVVLGLGCLAGGLAVMGLALVAGRDGAVWFGSDVGAVAVMVLALGAGLLTVGITESAVPALIGGGFVLLLGVGLLLASVVLSPSAPRS